MLFETGELLAIGATLYCKSVPYAVVELRYRSTDPLSAYKEFDEEHLFVDYRAARKSWDEHGLPEKVAFRLHVNLPDAQRPLRDVGKGRANLYEDLAGSKPDCEH